MTKSGIEQMMVEPLIIGEEQEAFGVLVQSTDRIDLLGKSAERGQCGPLTAELAQYAKWFVNDKVSVQSKDVNFRIRCSQSENPLASLL